MASIREVKWGQGFPNRGIDAGDAYNATEEIREAKGGSINPAELVETLDKDEGNVLRAFFEWDDGKAAIDHRVEQARGLLRAIHVIYEDAPESETRAYEIVEVPQEDAKAIKLYRRKEDVMSDPDTRADLFDRALRELMSLQRRYRVLRELEPVFLAIKELLAAGNR